MLHVSSGSPLRDLNEIYAEPRNETSAMTNCGKILHLYLR